MKSLSTFLPRLLPHVLACPEPLAEQALIDSAIDFCEKSTVIRYIPDVVDTVVGQATYDLDLPPNTDFSRVVYLRVNGCELSPVLTEEQPVPDAANMGPTRYFISQNDDELLLHLYPTPDKVMPIEMSLVTRPTRNARQVADDLYTYWQEAVVAGALYRLMSVPGNAFSNEVSAMYYGKQAHMLCHNARNESNIGRVVGSLDVRQRPLVR